MSVARCCGVTERSWISSSYRSLSVSISRIAPLNDLGFILVIVAMSPTLTALPSNPTRSTLNGTLQHSSLHPPKIVGPVTVAKWLSEVGVRSITWMVGVRPPPPMGTLARPITMSLGILPAVPSTRPACTNASLAQQSAQIMQPRQFLLQHPSRSIVITGKMTLPEGSRALNSSTTLWLGAQKQRLQHSLFSSTRMMACCFSMLKMVYVLGCSAQLSQNL
mmetsp:Transcript_17323/g.42657  ORF Transcript_17323/g.42657 Transcript_17323/m.42657 type:complete len:220 (+) Transcript_17323:795-1454(+)